MNSIFHWFPVSQFYFPVLCRLFQIAPTTNGIPVTFMLHSFFRLSGKIQIFVYPFTILTIISLTARFSCRFQLVALPLDSDWRQFSSGVKDSFVYFRQSHLLWSEWPRSFFWFRQFPGVFFVSLWGQFQGHQQQLEAPSLSFAVIFSFFGKVQYWSNFFSFSFIFIP